MPLREFADGTHCTPSHRPEKMPGLRGPGFRERGSRGGDRSCGGLGSRGSAGQLLGLDGRWAGLRGGEVSGPVGGDVPYSYGRVAPVEHVGIVVRRITPELEDLFGGGPAPGRVLG